MNRIFQPKGKNKFNTRKIEVDGIKFDSKKESERWQELKLLEKAGDIFDLQRQVKFLVIPKQKKSDGTFEKPTYYVADFVYFKEPSELKEISDWGKSRGMTIEDVKGLKSGSAYELFVVKRKLMLERYGIEVREV